MGYTVKWRADTASAKQPEIFPTFDAAKEPGNPFVGLPDLPPDIADALEQFKLSIVRHRASKWADISQKQMLDVLDALKLFVDR